MDTKTTHTHTVQRAGRGYVRAVCACGWQTTDYPTRTVEGSRLAERDARDHAAHMGQGPNRYCTNSCPHLAYDQVMGRPQVDR
jgi:hypothetical protein